MTDVFISKRGNIRLPKAVMKELGLQPGQKVRLVVEGGRAILETVRPKTITLEWIIAESKRLGPENAPETVEWGPDRGTERFYDYD
jgi:antitoxin MazE